MDESITKALKRKDELIAELQKVERFIKAYNALFGTEPEQHETPNGAEVVHRKRRRKLKPVEISDIAMRIITEIGEPQTRGQLVTELEKRDVILPAADKPRYIGTVLWRQKEKFVNIENRGYWVRGRDCPACGYIAADDPDGVGRIVANEEAKAREMRSLQEALGAELFK